MITIGTQGDGQLVTINADDLTKHMICLGMTGSGKTGLCIHLLEEMADHNIPLLILDLKGDITNMALPVSELSSKLGVEIKVWSPGGSAAAPVNLLSSFKRPEETGEIRQEVAISTISGLFALMGESPDPLMSPHHILLTKILEHFWGMNQNPSLEEIVRLIVAPPFFQIGVMELDEFLSKKQRQQLAQRMNGLLASPSLHIWSQGGELDFDHMIEKGINIFYLAHLDSNQRQFFISQFMSRLLAWSRSLRGSATLRCAVYVDEVAGYLPPAPHNPASKRPILTLFKQARGVGIGMILTTQNPVDLDYAAISNAGTWMIGRLQTRQDREKVLAGMESSHQDMGSIIGGLIAREFVINQATMTDPIKFRSLNTLTHLNGPVTRQELVEFSQKTHTHRYRHLKLGMESVEGETYETFQSRVKIKIDEVLNRTLLEHKQELSKNLTKLVEKEAKLHEQLTEIERESGHRKVAEGVGVLETAFKLLSGRTPSITSLVGRRNQTSKANKKIDTLKQKIWENTSKMTEIRNLAQKDLNLITGQLAHLIDEIETF